MPFGLQLTENPDSKCLISYPKEGDCFSGLGFPFFPLCHLQVSALSSGCLTTWHICRSHIKKKKPALVSYRLPLTFLGRIGPVSMAVFNEITLTGLDHP